MPGGLGLWQELLGQTPPDLGSPPLSQKGLCLLLPQLTLNVGLVSKDTPWQTWAELPEALTLSPHSQPPMSPDKGVGDPRGSTRPSRAVVVGAEGREAFRKRESIWSLPGPRRAGREEVRHGGGSRRVITCATPVTNSGTPSDVSIFSQRHRMVITSRDSLRSSRGREGKVGAGRGRRGHSKHTQWLPDKHRMPEAWGLGVGLLSKLQLPSPTASSARPGLRGPETPLRWPEASGSLLQPPHHSSEKPLGWR